MVKSPTPIFLILQIFHHSDAFTTNIKLFSQTKTKNISRYHGTLTSENEVMGGVETFEEWWNKIGPCEKIKHSSFGYGQLRGLEYLGNSNSEKEIVNVPRRFVIQSSYPDDDQWDANLAVSLVKEVLLGQKSDIYGYCNLLTRGNGYFNLPSTSPDALRHWTESQRSILEQSASGRKICELADTQTKNWKRKYESLPSQEKAIITKDQFFWAMEAVHSRAFYGDFGGSRSNTVLSILIPLIASVIGAVSLLNPTNENSDLIAIACGLAIVAPTISQLFSKNQKDAVMLPFIDSANHMEEADSIIEFDPVKNSFTLSIGPKCIVPDIENKKQLFISYGVKTDQELLINYGFLPYVVVVDDEGRDFVDLDEEVRRDRVRRKMAEEYVKRNP